MDFEQQNKSDQLKQIEYLKDMINESKLELVQKKV